MKSFSSKKVYVICMRQQDQQIFTHYQSNGLISNIQKTFYQYWMAEIATTLANFQNRRIDFLLYLSKQIDKHILDNPISWDMRQRMSYL